jgi:hypothetical protein
MAYVGGSHGKNHLREDKKENRGVDDSSVDAMLSAHNASRRDGRPSLLRKF